MASDSSGDRTRTLMTLRCTAVFRRRTSQRRGRLPDPQDSAGFASLSLEQGERASLGERPKHADRSINEVIPQSAKTLGANDVSGVGC